MKLTEEKKAMIINFGAFGYNAQKIASILDINIEEVEKEIIDKTSEISKLLKKGRDYADYVIDLKLFEKAKEGDIKSLEKLEYRKKIRK